jgi:hypothetical protein
MIEELVAFHLAGAGVTLLQFARGRDRRLLPLAILFVCLAAGFHLGEWNPFGRLFLYGAGLSGLGLLFSLAPRARPRP